MSKRRDIIRVGDSVRVVSPEFVVRVGYPRDVESYATPEVEDAVAEMLTKLGCPSPYTKRGFRKVVDSVAYCLAKRNGFGGNERSLHLESKPELLNQVFVVDAVRTVMTGSYYPPSGGYGGYEGDYDWEPGGLSNAKAHRLLTLGPSFEPLEIERSHVVKSVDELAHRGQDHGEDRARA